MLVTSGLYCLIHNLSKIVFCGLVIISRRCKIPKSKGAQHYSAPGIYFKILYKFQEISLPKSGCLINKIIFWRIEYLTFDSTMCTNKRGCLGTFETAPLKDRTTFGKSQLVFFKSRLTITFFNQDSLRPGRFSECHQDEIAFYLAISIVPLRGRLFDAEPIDISNIPGSSTHSNLSGW